VYHILKNYARNVLQSHGVKSKEMEGLLVVFNFSLSTCININLQILTDKKKIEICKISTF